MRKALIGFALGAAVFASAHAALAADAGVAAPAAFTANAAANGPSAAAEPQAAGFTKWLSTGGVKVSPTKPDIAICMKCAAQGDSCCSSGGGQLQAGIIWFCC
jgi:hypothetical protein